MNLYEKIFKAANTKNTLIKSCFYIDIEVSKIDIPELTEKAKEFHLTPVELHSVDSETSLVRLFGDTDDLAKFSDTQEFLK